MDRSPTFEQVAAWFRARPFVVACVQAVVLAYRTGLVQPGDLLRDA